MVGMAGVFLSALSSWIEGLSAIPVATIIGAGTWAIPSKLADAKKIQELLQKPLSSEEASTQLTNLFGDDDLFDELADVGKDKGKDADVRPVVIKHIKKLVEDYEERREEYPPFGRGVLSIYRKLASVKSSRNSPTKKLFNCNWEKVRPSTVAKLIKEGADVNYGSDETVLRRACYSCPDPKIIKMLIEAGADIDGQKEGVIGVPLASAVCNPNLEIMTTLIEAGADVNATRPDKKISPAIFSALHSPNLSEAVALLLKHGADIHLKGYDRSTLIHAAAGIKKALKELKFFIDEGLSVNEQEGGMGNFPLNDAADDMNYQAIEILLDAGARVNVVNYFGESPLHNAATRSCVRSVALLLKAGADVNAKSKSGYTPLHYAAGFGSSSPKAEYGGNGETVALLLKHGADVHARSNFNDTPINCIDKSTHLRSVTLLLKAGADINTRGNFRFTPLHSALGEGCSYEVICFLIKQGADLHAKNKVGDTPLHRAVWGWECRDHDISITTPIEAGARLDIKNDKGESVLDCMKEKAADDEYKGLMLLYEKYR